LAEALLGAGGYLLAGIAFYFAWHEHQASQMSPELDSEVRDLQMPQSSTPIKWHAQVWMRNLGSVASNHWIIEFSLQLPGELNNAGSYFQFYPIVEGRVGNYEAMREWQTYFEGRSILLDEVWLHIGNLSGDIGTNWRPGQGQRRFTVKTRIRSEGGMRPTPKTLSHECQNGYQTI
jgi:hypothetical protein